MAEFRVHADGITLAGEESGEGTPVVLLHGLTATRRYVVMGSTALQRSGHRVVAYDARAHGKSDPGPPYTYERLAQDLLAVLDDREIGRAVLAGASMGAHTLAQFARSHPERVPRPPPARRRPRDHHARLRSRREPGEPLRALGPARERAPDRRCRGLRRRL